METHSERGGGAFARFAFVVAALSVVAALAPPPRYSDRAVFESVGRYPFAVGCSDVHCFRVLVPWVMEHVPGTSLVKMRVYAVLFNAAAAVAVGYLCLLLGLSASAARSAVWLSALGTGALATISNPYTADPVMFLFGPLLTMLLLRDRVALAGGIAGFGIFAKEFAAVPLWIFALYAWLVGRRDVRARTLTAAAAVTLLWLAFHVILIASGHAGYGDNPSTRLFAGGYLRVWFQELGARGALAAIVSTFGALYLLMPAGFVLCTRQLRQLVMAALPAVLAFVYVETPERALWNFSFLLIPLAALPIGKLPDPVAWLFIATYGLASVRLGAQITLVPASRYALTASVILAIAALVNVWRSRRLDAAGVS